jgi:DnaJ-class molecular chaperone
MKNYYEILGLTQRANETEVKSAYRKLALKWHPDKHEEHNKEIAETKFKEITEAYQVLSDLRKRREYDMKSNSADFDFTPYFRNPQNIFDEFFGQENIVFSSEGGVRFISSSYIPLINSMSSGTPERRENNHRLQSFRVRHNVFENDFLSQINRFFRE